MASLSKTIGQLFDLGFALQLTSLNKPWFRITLYSVAFWATINTLLAKTQILDFRLKLWYCSPITKLLILAVACKLLQLQLALTSFLVLGLSLVPLAMDLTASGGVERVLWAWAVILSPWDDPTTVLTSCQPSLVCHSTVWGQAAPSAGAALFAHLSSITQFETPLMWAYVTKVWSKLTHA